MGSAAVSFAPMARMQLELLAPAATLATGRVAIQAGADALYIGPPQFGARYRAANSLDDIATLAQEAHLFDVRVYATLNTLLYDSELKAAERMAWALHECGVDALIVQDMAFAQMHLPPVELHASTQADCRTPEKVQFLERCGFSRIILARELPPAAIARIRQCTSVELEAFVHGALCVCYSGQCYLSEYLGARSANRGRCAQPCRLPYTLTTLDGQPLACDQHLLSLCDLDRSDHLEQLIQAGISSFKIEGRLKDAAYVQNITAFYRQRIDTLIARNPSLARRSTGHVQIDFEPDPALTFSRPRIPYLLEPRPQGLACRHSPKSMGEPLGPIAGLEGNRITIATWRPLHAGDGLVIVSGTKASGLRVECAHGNTVEVRQLPREIRPGDVVYRNANVEARRTLVPARVHRSIAARITLQEAMNAGGYDLVLEDESGHRCSLRLSPHLEPARNADSQRTVWAKQLGQSHDARVQIASVRIEVKSPPFLPIARVNALRRDLVDMLIAVRMAHVPPPRTALREPAQYPASLPTDYRLNVTNKLAQNFYRVHGVANAPLVPQGFVRANGAKELMRTKYCVRYELGLCPRQNPAERANDLRLRGASRPLRLSFDCARCEMVVRPDEG